MKIYFYNTLTKTKEEFNPLEENTVRIYSCGPTVYKDATIGNMKSYIFMDTLRRVLKYNGYNLKHAMNITDVGHLVSDADEGEDKMIKAAKQEKKTPLEIAEFYTEKFFEDFERLNIELKNSKKKLKRNGDVFFEITSPKKYIHANKSIYKDMRIIEEKYNDNLKIICRCGFITGDLKINMIIK